MKSRQLPAHRAAEPQRLMPAGAGSPGPRGAHATVQPQRLDALVALKPEDLTPVTLKNRHSTPHPIGAQVTPVPGRRVRLPGNHADGPTPDAAAQTSRAPVEGRPRLLDLYCGAGGAAMGYHRAGFEVTGVDNRPQPHYPFEFIQADALEYLAELTWLELAAFAAIHASPPCQAYSALRTARPGRAHPDLVAPTRAALEATGLPWVLENVPGAPMKNAYTICGGGLGLGTAERHLQRHRLFEVHGFEPGLIPPCSHPSRHAHGVYGRGRWDNAGSDRDGGYQGTAAENAEAMGIDWMNRDELAQAIPPAYTELLGRPLLEALAHA